MNPQTNTEPYTNPLAAMQQGEQLIFAIKRHPIGILFTYIMAGFILIVLGLIIFGAAPLLAQSRLTERLGVSSHD